MMDSIAIILLCLAALVHVIGMAFSYTLMHCKFPDGKERVKIFASIFGWFFVCVAISCWMAEVSHQLDEIKSRKEGRNE